MSLTELAANMRYTAFREPDRTVHRTLARGLNINLTYVANHWCLTIYRQDKLPSDTELRLVLKAFQAPPNADCHYETPLGNRPARLCCEWPLTPESEA